MDLTLNARAITVAFHTVLPFSAVLYSPPRNIGLLFCPSAKKYSTRVRVKSCGVVMAQSDMSCM